MASAVRNHVVDGLNGVSQTAFSIDQLKDEILITASAVVKKLVLQGILEEDKLGQRIDGIPVECTDISSRCMMETGIEAPHFEIPGLNISMMTPISYLGTMDNTMDFKVYFDRDFRYHKYRLATSRRPYAWVSTVPNAGGLYSVYLFNTGKYSNIRFVSIDAIFDNPYDILGTDYYDQFSAAEFYAPKIVQSEVIDLLTQKYVQYYRQLNTPMKPNTQQA